MEKAAANGQMQVIPGDFGWNDIGTYEALSVLHPADAKGNVMTGDTLLIDSQDCTAISTSRLVVLLGAKDLIVAETPDAILVCDRKQAQQIKKITAILESENRTEV